MKNTNYRVYAAWLCSIIFVPVILDDIQYGLTVSQELGHFLSGFPHCQHQLFLICTTEITIRLATWKTALF